MKKFVLIPILILLAGCQSLDIQPRNGLVEAVAFENFAGYESYIAKVYASLTLTGQFGAAGSPDLSIINDEGFSSYLRVWWKAQELTTDEAVIAWNDSGIRDLHNHAWGSSNQFVRVLYYRIYYTVALCNDFLRVSADLPSGLSAQEAEEIRNFRNEARFIRALAHSHALDLYRNVPIITSISSDLPVQSTPQEVFDFINDELTDLEDLILDPSEAVYGRVNKAAVWMLQARLNLNSEVYTGVDRSADALTAVQKVTTVGYSIAANYKELFRGDNNLRTDEIIWAIVHDGLVSQTWGGTTTLVRGAIGEAMQNNLSGAGVAVTDEALTKYGVPGGWGGYRATSSLVNKFDEVVLADDLDNNASNWSLPGNGSWSYSSTNGRLNYTPISGDYLNDGVAISPSIQAGREVEITFDLSFRGPNGNEVSFVQPSDEISANLRAFVGFGDGAAASTQFQMKKSTTYSFRANTSNFSQIRFYAPVQSVTGVGSISVSLDLVNITYTDGDGRFIFFTEGQTLDIADVGTFTNGWAVPKWTNLVAGGGRAPGVDQVSTDFPVFRLADAYLMQAEAELRANGTITGTTLGFLNELRQRAYGDNSGDLVLGDVTLDFILDERAREMYLEGTRRTDLIRFGKFTGGDYIWPWKGGVVAGVATDDHLNIFPIPSSELIANPRMKQNDGY